MFGPKRPCILPLFSPFSSFFASLRGLGIGGYLSTQTPEPEPSQAVAKCKCLRSTLSPLRSCRVWLHLQGRRRGREAGAGGQHSLVAGRRTGSWTRTAGAAGGQRRDECSRCGRDVQSQPGSATTTRGPSSAAATERATGLFPALTHLLLCGSAHRRLLHSPETATSRPPTPPTLPTPPTRPAPSAGSHSAPAAWCRSATASTSSTTAAPLCG